MLKAIGFITLCFVGFLVVGCFIVSGNIAKSLEANSPRASTPEKKIVAAPQWAYSTEKDDMSDQVVKVACLTSTNKLNLAFPYNGGVTADFCFRRRSGKLDGYVEMTKGQILCGVYDCKMNTRFDEGAVETHRTLKSRTYEPNLVFLTDTASLMGKIRRAKRMRIGFDLYQEGQQTFEFSPSPLDESRLK